jgi:hypothetical protein
MYLLLIRVKANRAEFLEDWFGYMRKGAMSDIMEQGRQTHEFSIRVVFQQPVRDLSSDVKAPSECSNREWRAPG